MDLTFERKISTNDRGSSYLNIPKGLAEAFGTKTVTIVVRENHLEIYPKGEGKG